MGRRIKSIVLAIIIWRLSDSVRRIYVNRICEYYCCCCLLWMSLDVIVPSIFSCSGEHKRNDVLFVLLNWARNTRITHHLSHSGGFAWPLHWNDWVLHALPSIQPVDIYCVIWDGEHAHNSCAYKLFAIECFFFFCVFGFDGVSHCVCYELYDDATHKKFRVKLKKIVSQDRGKQFNQLSPLQCCECGWNTLANITTTAPRLSNTLATGWIPNFALTKNDWFRLTPSSATLPAIFKLPNLFIYKSHGLRQPSPPP